MMMGTLARGFIAALAIRWAYALIIFAAMGEAGLRGVDSETYIIISQRFAAAIAAGTVHGWDWFGPHTALMPLYGLFTACIQLLFGSHSAIAYVLIQGVIDSGTCALITLTAAQIDPRYAKPALIAAAINPTQIVMSGLFYPDTPFVFFVALSLLGTVRWILAPTATNSALTAIGLSCAALTRVLIAPWVVALVVVLAVTQFWRALLSRRIAIQLACILLVPAIFLGAVLARNVAQFGTWSLTSQGGLQLMTVVPWVKQAKDGTPWAETYQQLIAEHDRRYPAAPKDLFEESRRYSEVAGEVWRSLGLIATAKAWVYGAVINLVSPAVIISPPVIQTPRTGFYRTPGNSMTEKILNFLFHSESALYTWVLLAGGIGVAIIRLVQLVGGIALLRDSWQTPLFPVTTLFGLWLCFILAVNGPVASPKYRLPMEPVLNILTAIGVCRLCEWNSRRGQKTQTAEGPAGR